MAWCTTCRVSVEDEDALHEDPEEPDEGGAGDDPDRSRADGAGEVLDGEDEQAEDERWGWCPDCGTPLVGKRPLSWGFRFMFAATAVYLLYRFWQLIHWLAHHL